MRTKDLIKMLQEHDPTGELPIQIHGDGGDVIDMCELPGYYDGCYAMAELDEIGSVSKIHCCATGRKLVIYTEYIDDVIWGDPDIEIVYDGEYAERKKQKHDELRARVREYVRAKTKNAKIEPETFNYPKQSFWKKYFGWVA